MKKIFILLMSVICMINLYACAKSGDIGIDEECAKQEQAVKTITLEEDYRNFISKAGSYIYTYDTSGKLLREENISVENAETLANEQIDVLEETINVITNIETSTTEITALKTKYINSLSMLKDVYIGVYETSRGEMITTDVLSELKESLSLYGEFVNEINEFAKKY